MTALNCTYSSQIPLKSIILLILLGISKSIKVSKAQQILYVVFECVFSIHLYLNFLFNYVVHT